MCIEILGSLVGDESKALGDTVQPETFAREVLGFEEIEDEEEATQEGMVDHIKIYEDVLEVYFWEGRLYDPCCDILVVD